MTCCPSISQLIQLRQDGSGTLPDIAAHVHDCTDCRERIELLQADDDLATRIRDVSIQSRELGSAALPNVGAYELIREIGRGGMGVVYEALQPHLGRVVALKVLPALLNSLHPDSVQRFKAEAAAAARLRHPNIVPIYDYGEYEGCHFYAMERIHGVSLSDLIRKSDPPQRGQMRNIARQVSEVADALQIAHDDGVVHRDIKPSNLILSEDGRLMVTDFGLVKETGAEGPTRTQQVLGTWRYMSPEQVRGDQVAVDHRSDVYSLGVTLYELLTHETAISGKDDHEILRHILEREPTSPRRVNPAVPRTLEIICLKAMSKDLGKRYASARALGDDLRRYLEDRPIRARGPMWPARAVMLARRHRLLVAVGCAAVLLVTSAFFASMVLDMRRERSERQAKFGADFVALGKDMSSESNFEAAASIYRMALDYDPSLTYVYRLRALALAQLGEWGACLADLDEAIARSPRRDRLLLTRGMIQMMRDDPSAARTDFERAVRANPHLNEARILSWVSTPQPSAAIVDARPKITDELMIQLEAHLGGRAPAEAVLAAADSPRRQRLAHCALGHVALHQRRLEDAQLHFAACVELAESTPGLAQDMFSLLCRSHLDRQ